MKFVEGSCKVFLLSIELGNDTEFKVRKGSTCFDSTYTKVRKGIGLGDMFREHTLCK